MSAASDRHEKMVADALDNLGLVTASRPSVGTEYADVLIEEYNGKKVNTWLEVKMSHTDNLSNPRVFYNHGRWQTTYKTPAAKTAIDVLNGSPQAKQFVKDVATFANIDPSRVEIPTTKGGLRDPNAVPLDLMKAYFDQPGITRYIAKVDNFNMGKVVTLHYTIGKKEPAYYMQAGDDFYQISRKNPLSLSNQIPVLSGKGEFKVRVATRSKFYEVQAEIKIMKLPNSSWSVLPNSGKKNPFII